MGNKLLIILPCNSGAYVGDYWTKPNWQSVGKRLEDIRELIDYAAVDSIRTFHIEGKGLVHEKENHLVKGYDECPSWCKFDPKTHGIKKLNRLKDSIKLSLDMLSCYNHTFVLLSPRAYKLCFSKAVKERNLQERITILDIGESPAYYNKGVIELEKCIRTHLKGEEIPYGLFMPLGHEKYFQSKFGKYRRDKSFLKEYRIWEMF